MYTGASAATSGYSCKHNHDQLCRHNCKASLCYNPFPSYPAMKHFCGMNVSVVPFCAAVFKAHTWRLRSCLLSIQTQTHFHRAANMQAQCPQSLQTAISMSKQAGQSRQPKPSVQKVSTSPPRSRIRVILANSIICMKLPRVMQLPRQLTLATGQVPMKHPRQLTVATGQVPSKCSWQQPLTDLHQVCSLLQAM